MRVRVAQTPYTVAARSQHERLRKVMFPKVDLGCDTASQQSKVVALYAFRYCDASKIDSSHTSNHLRRSFEVAETGSNQAIAMLLIERQMRHVGAKSVS